MTQYPQHPMVTARESSNGLGIAGFACSLVGLVFTGGILCPVGLLLSLVALGRQPRGFAWAGLILGLLGTCGWALVFLLAGAALLAALGIGVIAIALTETEKVEITSDMINMAIAIKAYEQENRYLPADFEVLDLRPSTLIDPWGNRYQYERGDVDAFDIVSSGEDGMFGTEDDLRLTTLGDTWDAAGGFDMSVQEQDDGGTVRITVGDRSLTAAGGDDGGRVTIDLGDRTIEIVGDEEGGRISIDGDTGDDGDTGAEGGAAADDDDGHDDADHDDADHDDAG